MLIYILKYKPFLELYLLYAKLEEEHGLARHAMAVYERSTTAVLPEEQYEVISMFISLNKSRRNEIGIHSVTELLILQKKKKQLLPPAYEVRGRYCFHRCLSVHI